MTQDRAQLIQDLAKIEVADLLLARAKATAKMPGERSNSRAAEEAWTNRVVAAQFTPAEDAEFQRVRTEFRQLTAA